MSQFWSLEDIEVRDKEIADLKAENKLLREALEEAKITLIDITNTESASDIDVANDIYRIDKALEAK